MMAGPTAKKRNHNDVASRSKSQRPTKRTKKQPRYNSDSDEEEAEDTGFQPVNLLDSDNEDLDNAVVDDAASFEAQSDSESDDQMERKPSKPRSGATAKSRPVKLAQDAPADNEDEDEDQDMGMEADGDSYDEDDLGSDEDDEDDGAGGLRKTKSKRNDPSAFATSMSKILSTKLSTSRRADPMLSRSADAQKASRAALDGALEAKARKQMRQQKQLALEKGRVRDVLVATRSDTTGELEATTSEIMETERRLRKVAQRGVVKLFNAVRAAQVRGQQADKEARKEGFVGVKGREEKVTEMSRKGFLDLIASGGGGLKKGGLEEA
jgi:hypothetical protein